jgi:hypothetical protein
MPESLVLEITLTPALSRRTAAYRERGKEPSLVRALPIFLAKMIS